MGTSIHALPQIPASVLPLPQVPETKTELPSAPVSVRPLPSTPQTTLALPTTGVTLLPAGFVPYFPPELVAEATGEGTATAAVSGSLTAEATASSEGASSTDLLPIQYLAADVAGAGDASAEVTTAESITVDVSSEGTPSVDLAVRIDADASGSGSSSVNTAVRIDANTSGSGSAASEVTLVGVLMPNVSSEGTSSVSLRTFEPVSMNKSGATGTFGTSFTQVTGWVPDTANYPGSAVVNSDLISASGATNGTIAVSVRFENGSFSGAQTVTMQILVGTNPTPVGSFTSPSISRGSPQVVSWSVTGVAIPPGSAIRLEARASGSGGISATNTPASYVRVTQPEG